jgi:hypothetical protein
LSVLKGSVDSPAICKMLNQVISKWTSTSLYKFRQWSSFSIPPMESQFSHPRHWRNKSIPFTPISHPYVERVIGTVRRECLDQTLFWNEVDLQNKLDNFIDYYNNHREHSSLKGDVPAKFSEERLQSAANLEKFNWKTFCRGLIQLPIPA